MSDRWSSHLITRHLKPPTNYDMGVFCWKAEDGGPRRSTLKLHLSRDVLKISWTLWEDFTRPQDIFPTYRIVFLKTEYLPLEVSQADFIGKTLREWVDGAEKNQIFQKLPEDGIQDHQQAVTQFSQKLREGPDDKGNLKN